MLALLYCALISGQPMQDRCQQFSIPADSCMQGAYYPQPKYDRMMNSSNYPIMRDQACEHGQCSALLHRSECDICDTEECKRICSEQAGNGKSRTKELLEFVKEMVEKTRGGCSHDCEEPKGAEQPTKHSPPSAATATKRPEEAAAAAPPPTTTVTVTTTAQAQAQAQAPPATTASPAPASVNVVTITKNEVRTITMDTPSSAEAKAPPSTTSAAAQPCENQQISMAECLKTLKQTQDKPAKNIAPSRRKKPKRPACKQDEEEEEEECDRPRRKSTRSPDSNNTEDNEPSRSSPKRPREDRVITLTRTVDKLVTVEKPLTFFREFTTTYTVEKPVINYKITTVTENKVSTLTSTVVDIVTEYKTKTVSLGEEEGAGPRPAAASTRTKSGAAEKPSTSASGITPSIMEELEKCRLASKNEREIKEINECRIKLEEYEEKQKTAAAPEKTIASTASKAAPEVTVKTKVVVSTVTRTAEKEEPAKKKPRYEEEEPAEAPVAKTVMVPVYKTVTAEPEVITIYRTVGKKPKASEQCKDAECKKAGKEFFIRGGKKKMKCEPEEVCSDPNVKPFVNKMKRRRTVIHTIYAARRGRSSESDDFSSNKAR